MSKIKELFIVIIVTIFNIIIAFAIPYLLGISNIVIFRSYSIAFGDITVEVIIFFALSLIEAIIFECYNKNK